MSHQSGATVIMTPCRHVSQLFSYNTVTVARLCGEITSLFINSLSAADKSFPNWLFALLHYRRRHDVSPWRRECRRPRMKDKCVQTQPLKTKKKKKKCMKKNAFFLAFVGNEQLSKVDRNWMNEAIFCHYLVVKELRSKLIDNKRVWAKTCTFYKYYIIKIEFLTRITCIFFFKKSAGEAQICPKWSSLWS